MTFAVATDGGMHVYANGWLPDFQATLFSFLAWGADDTALFGEFFTDAAINLFPVTSSGIETPRFASELSLSVDQAIYYDQTSQFVFADDGDVFAAMQPSGELGLRFGLNPGNPNGPNCVVAPDGARNRVYYACQDLSGPDSHSLTIESFDLMTRAKISTLSLGNTDSGDFPRRMIRWGTDGLAVYTSTRLYLFHGAFVQ